MNMAVKWPFARLAQMEDQWLAAWTLAAVVVTSALVLAMVFILRDVKENTGLDLVSLELAGAYKALHITDSVKCLAADKVLAKWSEGHTPERPLERVKAAQWLDMWFPIAYGALYFFGAVGFWKYHPKYSYNERWVWLIALGSVAAVLDECENVLILYMLYREADIGSFVPLGASVLAISKFALLLLASIGFLVALWHVQESDSL